MRTKASRSKTQTTGTLSLSPSWCVRLDREAFSEALTRAEQDRMRKSGFKTGGERLVVGTIRGKV